MRAGFGQLQGHPVVLLQQGFKFYRGEPPLQHHNVPIDHRVGPSVRFV